MPREKPTKRRRIIKLSDLLQLSDCVEPSLSIKPFETVSESTPDGHSIYEHNELSITGDPSDSVKFLMPWDDPQQLHFLKSIVPISTEGFYSLFVNRSPEQCHEESLQAARSVDWHKARAFSVTASQFGSTVGHNKYMSKDKLLFNKLHPHVREDRGQEYIQWGVEHEVHAEEAFVAFLQKKECNFKIDHPGLLKDPTCSWTACSPDGILRRFENGVEIVELIEYKAPAYYRSATHHPYQKSLYNIPPMYLDQMQGSMWIIKNRTVIPNGHTLKGGWFVVWQPHSVHVTYVPYVQDYTNALMEGVKGFFEDDFVPACVKTINEVGVEKNIKCAHCDTFIPSNTLTFCCNQPVCFECFRWRQFIDKLPAITNKTT